MRTDMSKYPMGNFGKFRANPDELEAKARHIRATEPHNFAVTKLAKALHISTGDASRVYHRIIKGVD